MPKLIYVSNMSLDGCTEDDHGAFDWSEPDDDVFVFITDLLRPIGTHLYGRRMYQTMALWETDAALATRTELMSAFAAVWKAAEKVVYSTTLATVPTARTRLERHFDPAPIRDMKATVGSDLMIGGPTVAATALEAGLIDECHFFVWPVILGGAKPALPSNLRLDLELVAERRFQNGVVYLGYRLLR